MIEDKLQKMERVRLEALNQANQRVMGKMTTNEEFKRITESFENYILYGDWNEENA